MTEPMDATRFAAILDAYGAAPRRWPTDEREAALAFVRRDPAVAARLERAGRLDDRLDRHAVAAPTLELGGAALAGAARYAPARRRLRLWWTGAALGLAGLAGALVGEAATAALAPAMPLLPLYAHEEATAFGALPVES